MPSAEVNAGKLLIVTIGNPLRSDDGVAAFIQERLERQSFARVVFVQSQQLNLELLEDLNGYDLVILIDAAATGEAVEFKKVVSESSRRQASSHHLSAELLVSLNRQIYGTELNLYVCSVKGENFELGDTLSSEVEARAVRAVELLTNFIKEHHYA